MTSEVYKEFFLENGYAKVDSILSQKTLELCRKSYDAVFESKETGKHRHDLGGHVESKIKTLTNSSKFLIPEQNKNEIIFRTKPYEIVCDVSHNIGNGVWSKG